MHVHMTRPSHDLEREKPSNILYITSPKRGSMAGVQFH